MRKYTNIKAFLSAEERQCSYHYRMSKTRHIRVLLGNHLYQEFAKEVTNKLWSVQNRICNELKVSPLPQKSWTKIRLKLLSRVKSMKSKEKISVSMNFELDDNYELSVELITCIS